MASTSVTKNAQTAINFFKSKGWTDAQAAGIVGNLQAESGVDLNTRAFNSAGGNLGAAGIAQWRGPRQTAFEQRYGIPVRQGTLEQQLDYVNWELTQGPAQLRAAGTALKATTTASAAATVVYEQYEIGGATNRGSISTRVKYAQTLSGGVPEGVVGGTPAVPAEKPREEAAGGNFYLINNAPPIPNRLHDYPSYIYSLSLHLLTNEEWNNVVVTQKYTPKNVIIASAGRYSDAFPRNKHFNEDFYFNEFILNTVICPNDESRNTNAIDTRFSIIEPYGFTLVERIIAATKDIGGKNYLDMPYLVQLDFFAVDEAGNLVGSIQELQKRFPIKINTMDVKITEKGAEYTITASPYPHEAFKTAAVTVPANFEVTARTVADFFQSIEGTPDDTYVQDLLSKADLQQRQRADTQTAQTLNAPSSLFNSLNLGAAKSLIKVDSFGTAINAYWKGLEERNKIDHGDVYRFEFLPDPDTGQDVIGSATFVEEKRNTPKETPMKKNEVVTENISMRLSDVGNSQNIYDTSRGIFSINYGTNIVQLLEYVIRNSSYIQDQLVIPDGMSQQEYQARKEEMKNKPLKWFRIIPKVRLLGYCSVRKVYAKEITYVVKPYKLYNVRNDLAPQGVAVSPVKNYNYIFTGKNDDIVDCDIKFNFLYYDQQTGDRSTMNTTAPTGSSYTEDFRSENSSNYTGPGDGLDYNVVMPLTMKPVVRNTRGSSASNPTTVAEVASTDLAESIMSSSQADMLVVKLKIIGDPDFIKQDDFFYSTLTPQEGIISTQLDPRLLPNGGSLRMDDGGVYVQLLFKVPRDIDDATGFMKYDAGQFNSVFSGLYMVNTVRSEFSQGKFLQDLDLIRLPRQVAFDYVGSNNAKPNARVSTSTVPGVLGVNVDPPTPPILMTGGAPAASTADAADTQVDQTPGQDQQAAEINNADLPPLTNEQEELSAVRETAPTVSINEQNQTPPVPFPQPPANQQESIQDIKREISRISASADRASGPAQIRSVLEQQTNALERLYLAEFNSGNLAEAERVKRAIDSNKELLKTGERFR